MLLFIIYFYFYFYQNLFLNGRGLPPGCPSVLILAFTPIPKPNPTFPKVVRPPKRWFANCATRKLNGCVGSLYPLFI